MVVLSISALISDIECSGSKNRFDAILAQFGFSGTSPTSELQDPHPSKGVRNLTNMHFQRKVPALLINDKVESERQNEIPDEKQKVIRHGFFTIVVKRKNMKKRTKTTVPIKSVSQKMILFN